MNQTEEIALVSEAIIKLQALSCTRMTFVD